MKNITRVKAGLIHFCLSLTIFSIIFFVLFTLWYPEPYFTASGGWQGLKIAASIDIVLGPLLTLIIFNPQKSARLLSIDLAVIACVQTAALIWGIFTIYNQRPIAVVFWYDSFFSVAASDLKPHNYPIDNLKQFSKLNPPLIYVEKPKNLDELKQFMSQMRDNEIVPHLQTNLYRPLNEHFHDISSQQLNINDLLKTDPTLRRQVDDLLNKTKLAIDDVLFYSLKAKYQDIILAFTSEGEQVGYITPTKQSQSLP